ncbi:hypothetical protein ABL78_4981 [Leptomonas seymouri]|uniref:PAP-associated domain-containing protein n=1 Tax=Leptomonas seymouri TaxID=5684 RepID=A0A0N0P528_LEPSE|nr:hypothetical protein ABL78_4981 [Leptomonas seymouri]|eukprot:KPI85979.1 hypothetical protein ABL78_4981 [Leptomonas seymouri]
MQPNHYHTSTSTCSSAHAVDPPNGNRYVHCPYYIPATSPLAASDGALDLHDSGLHDYSPARVGSLGTPRTSESWSQFSVAAACSSYAFAGSNDGHLRPNSGATHFTPDASSSFALAYHAADSNNAVLLPTPPLLKALAKQCQPSPPWCVGSVVPPRLGDEVLRFNEFNTPTQEEEATCKSCAASMEAILQRVWPGASLQPSGATAAGQSSTKGATVHYYATGTSDATEEQMQTWMRAANEVGAQVSFTRDNRELPCAVLIDSRTGHRCCIRYGDNAVEALAETSELLWRSVAACPVTLAAFNTLLALLSQNRILDESGSAHTLLSGEAVAIMLLAVVNSYDSSDVPDAGRVLLDFFLTYGFESYFNAAQSSVSVRGFGAPTAKKHPNAQLSVLDPIDEMVNVTPRVDRFGSIQAVFNYCYAALLQYAQVRPSLHRAQSALSTIIGGEPYWVRVLRFYHLQVEPYHSVIQLKKHLLVQHL